VRPVVERCLRKDAKRRFHDIGDVKIALEEGLPAGAPDLTPRTRPLPWIIASAAVVFAVLAAVAALWVLWREAPAGRPLALQVNPPQGTRFALANGGGAISPDGKMIALVVISSAHIPKLWLRSLDSMTAREIPGTDGAQYPFWSPDSRTIGFFAGGKLKRAGLPGGEVVSLADAPDPRGATWTERGILFAPAAAGGLQLVPANGGTPTPVTKLDAAAQSHRWPQTLPDGSHFLYMGFGGGNREIRMASFDHPEGRKLGVTAPQGGAIYVRPRGDYAGYLLWRRQGVLTAQVFDYERGQLSGEPMAVPGGEMVGLVLSANLYSGLSASNDGIILASQGSDRNRLAWLNREGKVLGTVLGLDYFAGVIISPEGNRAALSIDDTTGNRPIWVLDFARGVRTRLSPEDYAPIWSADGRRIVYHNRYGGPIFERDASGAGPQRTLLDEVAYADDVSPDGRYLMYEQYESGGSRSLKLLPLLPSGGAGGKSIPYLKTAGATSALGRFSPDGQWVAYADTDAGPNEVYVQSFPTPRARVQVSDSGGSFPRWRKDGKELFFRATDGRLMVAAVRNQGGRLEFGTPSALFRIQEFFGVWYYPYDVSADGQRILALMPDATESAPLTVLMNWQAGLKK
jgi:Tol biopolymer transport system component